MKAPDLTHGEWCRHLSLIGQLKDEHRVCARHQARYPDDDICVAGRVEQREAS